MSAFRRSATAAGVVVAVGTGSAPDTRPPLAVTDYLVASKLVGQDEEQGFFSKNAKTKRKKSDFAIKQSVA